MKRGWIVVVIAVAYSGLPAGLATAQKADTIQQLLDARAEAVSKSDKARFLATVDPSDAGFVDRQTRLFAGISSLKISGYTLTPETERLPDLARDADRKRYEAEVSVHWVKERFVLEGFDEKPSLNDLFLTFVKRSGGWLIASDTDVEDLGLLSSRTIWDHGEVTTQASEHFLVLSHPDFADRAKALPSLAEKALGKVERAWSGPWTKKVPLVVPSSSEELDRMTGGTVDVNNFVAFASYSVEQGGEDLYEPVGYRVVVNPAKFFGPSAESTLSHELVHIATRPASGPFIPIFLDEGLAQLSEISDFAATSRRAKAIGDGNLPDDHEFVSGSQRSIISAYDEALSALLFLREMKGAQGVQALYGALGKAQGLSGTGEYHLDRALRDVAGMSLADFEAAWKKW